MIPSSLQHAFEAAVAAGNAARGSTSPNPPVGAAIVNAHGDIVGIGCTQPPSSTDNAHAEVMALRAAGTHARGGVAVVTLEPCNHHGRTGPCSHALAAAGVSEVYYAVSDPHPQAAGGADYLRSQGIPATLLDEPVVALDPWLVATGTGRSCVTAKMAHTLDGFSAAEDGSSQWITGSAAREHALADRAHRDAIIVGTGTVIADNPQLTARAADGSLCAHQPQRVVVGTRAIPSGAHLDSEEVWRFQDLDAALAELWSRGLYDVLLEGGPTLVGSALAGGRVDFLHNYVNPSFLTAGLTAVATPPLPRPTTMADIARYELERVVQLGGDALLVSRRTSPRAPQH